MAGGWWETRVVPRLVEKSLTQASIMQVRRETLAGLGGRLLELGFGSGINLEVLPGAVSGIDAVEPSDTAWRMSAARREASSTPVQRVGLDGQQLDVADASYDSVLCTFTLCTIPDPALALAEVRRVLRAGGSFTFLEHGRAPTPGMARWQRLLNPIHRRAAGGCHLDRDVPGLVEAAGLELDGVRAEYLPGPHTPWTFGYSGAAYKY